MKSMTMIKKDLKEIQNSFNPEKSTYKVFDELIKNKYTPEEMINVLSKIRGIHKYPDFLKAQFLDVINNLNLLKEHEDRKKEAEKREEEKMKQQANTRELKDIITSLEQAKEDNKKKNNKLEGNKQSEPVKKESENVLEKTSRKSLEFLEEVGTKAMSKVKSVSSDETADDGRSLFIVLLLLVVISLVGLGLFILLY